MGDEADKQAGFRKTKDGLITHDVFITEKKTSTGRLSGRDVKKVKLFPLIKPPSLLKQKSYGTYSAFWKVGQTVEEVRSQKEFLRILLESEMDLEFPWDFDEIEDCLDLLKEMVADVAKKINSHLIDQIKK